MYVALLLAAKLHSSLMPYAWSTNTGQVNELAFTLSTSLANFEAERAPGSGGLGEVPFRRLVHDMFIDLEMGWGSPARPPLSHLLWCP